LIVAGRNSLQNTPALVTATDLRIITMSDFLFATVLFVAYFSFVCCLLGERTSAESSPSAVQKAEEVVPSALVEDVWDEQPINIAEVLGAEVDPERELGSSTLELPKLEPTLEELLLDIDLDTLPLRPARKICGRLGIQQKVNSKDAPLSWLRTQIKAKLSEKPTEVVPVIQEVLQAS